jgi:hypothetical protein
MPLSTLAALSSRVCRRDKPARLAAEAGIRSSTAEKVLISFGIGYRATGKGNALSRFCLDRASVILSNGLLSREAALQRVSSFR